MARIIISPKACAVALALYGGAQRGITSFLMSDQFLSAVLDIEPDTVYRALVELQNLGALTFTRPRRAPTGTHRVVTLHHDNWVWVVIEQRIGTQAGA